VNILQADKSPNASETLGSYVKRIRLSLGLNQREFATIAGIHLQSLGKIERGLTTKEWEINNLCIWVSIKNS